MTEEAPPTTPKEAFAEPEEPKVPYVKVACGAVGVVGVVDQLRHRVERRRVRRRVTHQVLEGFRALHYFYIYYKYFGNVVLQI